MARSALINNMVQAVRKASRGVMRDFGELDSLQSSQNGVGSFGLQARKKATKSLVSELLYLRPDFGFYVDEENQAKGKDSQHCWYIAPLDGFANYCHAHPYFTISVVLTRQSVPIALVIYNPVEDELFVAENGRGAFCNDRLRIRVSSTPTLNNALIANILVANHHEHFSYNYSLLQYFSIEGATTRLNGAVLLDLAYVACGRLDAVWLLEADELTYHAAQLLMQEAGGFVSDFTDNHATTFPTRMIAGSDKVHKKLLDGVKVVAMK